MPTPTTASAPAPITPYNFFFHPLHADHREDIRGVSILTNVALTALTGGWYLVAFAAVHAREYMMIQQAEQAAKAASSKPANAFDSIFPAESRVVKFSHGDFVGIPALKKKQREHLKKLEDLAQQGHWTHIQKQTMHPLSSFNAWMLPTSSASEKHGDRYRLTPYNIEMLRNDAEWMKNYRRGVCLIAKSWGWDLNKFEDRSNKTFHWANTRGSLERAGTMLQSLTEFGKPVKVLRDRLIGFMEAHKADQNLAERFNPYLKPIKS